MTDEPVFDIERIGSRFVVTTDDERFTVYVSLSSLAEARAEIERLLALHRDLVAETMRPD